MSWISNQPGLAHLQPPPAEPVADQKQNKVILPPSIVDATGAPASYIPVADGTDGYAWQAGGGGGTASCAQTIGDGATTEFTITHDLDSTDVLAQVTNLTNSQIVYPTVTITNANQIEATFSVAPTADQMRILIVRP